MRENLYQDAGAFIPDNLFAGNELSVLTGGVTIAAGQGILRRGTVLGIVTASGKAVAVDKAAADGSNVPYGILTDDVDATTETNATVYISGVFNKNALFFGGDTDTAADYETELRKLGIFLKNVI